MALIPLMDCYGLLDIDPKTLRTSLKRADIRLSPHPTDARIKCLTTEQIELLAAMHSRLLRPQTNSTTTQPEGMDVSPTNAAQTFPDTMRAEVRSQDLPSFQQDPGLFQKLAALETRVTQLSEHLAGLALILLQERDRTIERRISTLETVMAELAGKSTPLPLLPDPGTAAQKGASAVKPKPVRLLNPAEERARSRMPPLVEYSTQGTYVIVTSQEGELHLVPDSTEWFDWLATISSFRFVGQSGRFTAYRDSDRQGPTRSWRAHRCIHQHRYHHCLGVTDRLTIARLEQMAAKLQAYMDTL